MTNEENLPEIIRCPPVLMIAFARPSTLREVFAKVRAIRPTQLFLWLNKGRFDRPDEVRRNDECRAIFDSVDWPCEVHRMYNAQYLEITDSFEGAYKWLFQHVDRAIILEDDCVPDLTFFRFCGEMLEKYKDDNRIGMIGSSAPSKASPGIDKSASYYFDHYNFIWGWATWRDRWQKYWQTAEQWGKCNKYAVLKPFFHSPSRILDRIRFFDMTCYSGKGMWDGVWWLTAILNNWLCIHPSSNLMRNIGFFGTHAVGKVAGTFDRELVSLSFPLTHPKEVVTNVRTDDLLAKHYSRTPVERMVGKLKRITNLKRIIEKIIAKKG